MAKEHLLILFAGVGIFLVWWYTETDSVWPFGMERVGSAAENVTTLISGRTGKGCHTQIGEDRVSCDVVRPRRRPAYQPSPENFIIEHQSRDKFAIKNERTGKYCADDNNRLQCTRDQVGPWETFTALLSGDKVAIKGHRTDSTVGRFCGDDMSNIGCNRTRAGDWEWFSGSNVEAFVHPSLRLSQTAASLEEGATIRCADGTGMVYRFTGGRLRQYPSPAIAASWNPNWALEIKNLTPEQCAVLDRGPPMAMANATSPTSTSPTSTSLAEGDSVACNDGTGMVYRYTGGQLRYYPSPAIAASWNPNWALGIKSLTPEQCAALDRGPPMAQRPQPPPAPLPEPAPKLDPEPEFSSDPDPEPEFSSDPDPEPEQESATTIIESSAYEQADGGDPGVNMQTTNATETIEMTDTSMMDTLVPVVATSAAVVTGGFVLYKFVPSFVKM